MFTSDIWMIIAKSMVYQWYLGDYRDSLRSISGFWMTIDKKNIKMRSFKSSENIQKKEGGPDRSVSDNQSSSVTLNELAMKARKDTVISSFSKEVIH